MTWERARSDEQIEQRIRGILDATTRLYERHRVEEITFAMIAAEAHFTRSNLYRYFQTKEAIFLALLAADLGAWRDDILRALAGGAADAPALAELWVEVQLRHRRMTALLTILYTMLEPHAPLDALTTFKRQTLAALGEIAGELVRAAPFLSGEAAQEFIIAQMSLAIGIYPLMSPTARQQEAMAAVGVVAPPDSYRAVLTRATVAILIAQAQ